jgi:SAM-dependent methyltransferase
LPFADSAFDVAISLSTLDHFDRPEEIRAGLAELHRVLAPGGVLIVTLDNARNPAVWVRNALPGQLLVRLGLVPYAPGTTLSPRRIVDLVTASGFVVDERSFVLHCPRVLAVAAGRAVSRTGGAALSARYLRFLRRFERLERLPTRSLTGYFTATRAVKR